MKRALIWMAVLLGIALLSVGGWWYVNENPEVWFLVQEEADKAIVELGLEPQAQVSGLVASGFIEADEVSVMTEVGGRIVGLRSSEGDEVVAGQVVIELDDSLLQAQIEMSRADLAVAEAGLDLVRAGVRPETLAYAESMVGQAEVARDAVLTSLQDAESMLENPQELDLAITAVRSQLSVLDYQVLQAEAFANAAQVGRDLSDQVVTLLEDFEPFTIRMAIAPGIEHRENIRLPASALPDARQEQAIATNQSWQAWAGVKQAAAARTGAERYLAELAQQRRNPVSLSAQVETAKAQVRVAEAAIDLAQAQVDGLELGATPEQIAAVEAQVQIAQAALDALMVQETKSVLEAPITGLVLERPVHVGEVAVPGVPLMTLADLDNLTLTIYVAENQLGKVQIGQAVSVTVDAYPEQVFMGTVTNIASQAEFTPKNVQTREERVSMVFAVQVSLPNSDHALKPGMPADAVIPDSMMVEE